MNTEQKLKALTEANPTNEFYKSLNDQFQSKGNLSEKQLELLDKNYALIERKNEHIQLIEEILEHTMNTKFDPTFVNNLKENITKYCKVSDKQSESLNKIYNAWVKK